MIHYEANGADDFDPVEVDEAPQIAYPLESGAEIEAAAAALDKEDQIGCEDCNYTGILNYDNGEDGQRDQKCICQVERD